MPVLLLLAGILVVLALKILIGLFTRPVDTVQMLGIWICNTVGCFGAVIAGMLLFSGTIGGSTWTAEDVALLAGSGVAAVLAFGLSVWLRKRRLRNAYKAHFAAQLAAENALARRNARNG